MEMATPSAAAAARNLVAFVAAAGLAALAGRARATRRERGAQDGATSSAAGFAARTGGSDADAASRDPGSGGADPRSTSTRKVLVVTDIGADIDDTLALLYLARLVQQRRIELVGVVTSGGSTVRRARLASRILHRVLPPHLKCSVPCVPGRGTPLRPRATCVSSAARDDADIDSASDVDSESDGSRDAAASGGADDSWASYAALCRHWRTAHCVEPTGLLPKSETRMHHPSQQRPCACLDSLDEWEADTAADTPSHASSAVAAATTAGGSATKAGAATANAASGGGGGGWAGSADCDGRAAAFIAREARRHGPSLRLVVLGPMTDVAGAVEIAPQAMRSIHSLRLQGHATVHADADSEAGPDADAQRLRPDAVASYNVRCDPEAARQCFAALSAHVPFTTVGKWAAYAVRLRVRDFERWDSAAQPALGLTQQAMAGVAALRDAAPATFERVFGVAAHRFGPSSTAASRGDSVLDASTAAWIRKLPFVATPYDALVAMTVAELPATDAHFTAQRVPMSVAGAAAGAHALERQRWHLMIGNSPPVAEGTDGSGGFSGSADSAVTAAAVLDGDRTRAHIVSAVSAALSRAAAVASPADESPLTPSSATGPGSAAAAAIDATTGPFALPAELRSRGAAGRLGRRVRVLVGSTNPVKVGAVAKALVLNGVHSADADTVGVRTASGVPCQPVGVAETFGGAYNRACAARRQEPGADVWVGIENGLLPAGLGDAHLDVAAVCVLCAWGGDAPSLASSSGVQVPFAGSARLEEYSAYYYSQDTPDVFAHHTKGRLSRQDVLVQAARAALGRVL